MVQHFPNTPRILLLKPQTLRRQIELLVRVLFLRVVVRHVLVDVVHIRAAVVSIKRVVEVGAVEQVAEVLV